jgi:hypothetical protein
VGLKLNGTHQLLAYADDENLLADNVGSIKKNTRTLIDASKEVSLAVPSEKTKYMLSHHQDAKRNHNIKTDNRSFENMAQFKYLGTRLTYQNLMQEEIKRKLNSGNAYYHSVQNLSFSLLLFKNEKIRIYKTLILPVFPYECKSLSLTLREGHRLRVLRTGC